MPQEQSADGSTDQRRELAKANHVLVDQGILDGFGHVSVRSDEDPTTFLLARNLAPGLVQPQDVQVLTLDGDTDDPRKPYLERHIHAQIYRARPDVRAVVHSHSPAVIPFGVSSVPLRPILHMAGFLAPRVPVFEARDTMGAGSDLLVSSAESGVALAEALGDAAVVLMRGHGSTTVGGSLPEVVYRAIYTEVNARVQVEAERLGACTYLTDEEAAATVATNTPQIGRAWQYWQDRAV
ncbi:class II aldolase/adducin family protein [Blastococcus saxobsidens]|uniref:class II aldolase/adducin family protein n=1 Tax=Blastococcus saxobsidens TaxID=138336 RepID=UPI000CECDB1A|nr:class II aldolase/adducin family protein [Blastococcus saxobsidens]